MLRLLLLGSGTAALAYEVLWARDWALVYGSTAVGTAVVLAAYFAGLALGAGLAARLGRRRRGLGLYGALEAGVAATALLYLGVRPLLPEAAVWLARTAPPVLLPAARALLAFAVLVVPTTLLGATLPAATATLAPGDASGAGRLYAWNTCGGALGALGCGVVAIRVLGVRGTFLAAAGLDAAVAATALALARRTAAPAARRETGAQGAPPRLALVLAAAAGFAGLAGEVLWTRGLAGVLSQSVYSIALVLAAVLVGIALGAVTGVRALGRAGAPEAWLGIAFVALALATLLSRLALRALPGASVLLVRGLGVIGPGAGLAVEAALAVLVVLVPALALGAIFPLVLGLAGAAAPGRAMGRVLAANTAGGVAGALGAAFVLLPRLGLGGGLLATAGIAALAALATRRTAGALAAAAVALAALASPSFRLPWRAGDERILFYRDGAAATVMVTADARGDLRLRVNGQYSLGGSAGLLLEERQAHLPLLLHPRPTRLLALGVGTADTVGAALAHPGLRVDAVELVPEVLAAAAVFVRENRGALADPRARFVVDDARSFLLAAPGTYDVILSDLFLPWTAGTAYLYSADFYRVGRAHLRPGGLYCQWLPLHQLAVPDLEAIVASFTAAFPHVQLWVAYHRSATPLAALVGSAEPLGADAQPARARRGRDARAGPRRGRSRRPARPGRALRERRRAAPHRDRRRRAHHRRPPAPRVHGARRLLPPGGARARRARLGRGAPRPPARADRRRELRVARRAATCPARAPGRRRSGRARRLPRRVRARPRGARRTRRARRDRPRAPRRRRPPARPPHRRHPPGHPRRTPVTPPGTWRCGTWAISWRLASGPSPSAPRSGCRTLPA